MAGEKTVVVVCGSARPNSFTHRASALVSSAVDATDGVAARSYSVRDLGLALPGLDAESGAAEAFKTDVEGCSGVVLATPEYHGGYSSGIKLAIEHLGFPSVLAGKPIGLLGVAAGRIGAIKALEQLRTVCSHIGGHVLPGAVSVAGVQQMFDEDGRCTDEATEAMIRGLAASVCEYLERV